MTALNQADALFLDGPASAAFVGDHKVWPALIPNTVFWLPDDIYAIGVVSNGGRTFTAGANGVGIRGTAEPQTAKAYYEVVIGPGFTPGVDIRIGAASMTAYMLGTSGLGEGPQAHGFRPDGIQKWNGVVSSPAPAFGSGSTVGLAFDFITGRAWATVDGVTWNAGGAASPATGVGGYPCRLGTDQRVAFTSYQTGRSVTLPDYLSFAVPDGFVPWGAIG